MSNTNVTPAGDLLSSNVDIEVMIVIDTEYVKANFPNPSQNPAAPTGIDHKSQYMIAYDSRGIVSGQGTADLNFNAYPQDRVNFRGTSIYANSDDAVIVYGINYWSGTSVFNTFNSDLVNRTGAVMPAMGGNGLPAVSQSINFLSLSSTVAQKGTENFYVYFALYVCKDGSNQTLYGYYYWDPTITVI